MGYKVEFDTLDGLYNGLGAQTNQWLEGFQKVQAAVETLYESKSISGVGADNIRSYFESVHGTIIGLMVNLVSLHSANCLLYKQDYQRNIDTDLHAVIYEKNLNKIKEKIQRNRALALAVDGEVQYALEQVRDIFYHTYRDARDVEAVHKSAEAFLHDLDTEVKALEQCHEDADFVNSTQMLEALRAFISEQIGKGRTYKERFSLAELSNSASFRSIYEAYLSVQSELDDKTSAIETAIENENQRVADLEAEYEERENKATVINMVVTGVCVIGSIAAIAATGGAATPLVVAGISAASGAVIAGTHNVTGQYVRNGGLGGLDLKSLGKDVFVGAATGFVTGYLGATVSGAITSGLGNTAVGSTLLNSPNAVVRVGAGAVIGSVSQTGSGIVSRAAGTLVSTGGDFGAAFDSAFNKENIFIDAATGGAFGGAAAMKKPVGREISLEDIDKNLLENKPKNSPNPEKWIEKGGEIHVDGNGTWTYTTSDGVSAVYTDGHPDFARAGLVEKKTDIGEFSDKRSIDFRRAEAQTEKPAGTTWHHSENGHTLEAVSTKYHKLFTHRGGFSIVNGGK